MRALLQRRCSDDKDRDGPGVLGRWRTQHARAFGGSQPVNHTGRAGPYWCGDVLEFAPRTRTPSWELSAARLGQAAGTFSRHSGLSGPLARRDPRMRDWE